MLHTISVIVKTINELTLLLQLPSCQVWQIVDLDSNLKGSSFPVHKCASALVQVVNFHGAAHVEESLEYLVSKAGQLPLCQVVFEEVVA